MRVVKALDAGPILRAADRPILADETSEEVEHDLARLGAQLLVATIDDLIHGRVKETPQHDAAATYAPRLTKQDGAVDWSLPAVRVHDLIRGLHPWPHAFTFLAGTRLILLRSTPSQEPHTRDPGTILEAAGDHLIVGTGHGAIHLHRLQVEGKRAMTPREFLAGHFVSPGERMTPAP
jgi:methionyl-tRNA formyltransferase